MFIQGAYPFNNAQTKQIPSIWRSYENNIFISIFSLVLNWFHLNSYIAPEMSLRTTGSTRTSLGIPALEHCG